MALTPLLTLEHIHTGETAGYPALAFEDADRTIKVLSTEAGQAHS